MKTKKFQKKLSLNKGTVAHLGSDEEKRVKGGCRPTDPSACTYDCPTTSAVLCCDTNMFHCPTFSGDPCCR